MADVLIQNVPADVLEAIDQKATSIGLSRNEYLRRLLARERRAPGSVTVGALAAFAERFGEILDRSAMDQAWQQRPGWSRSRQ
jgi:hypothetical protein